MRKFTKYPSKIVASTASNDAKLLAKEALNCNTKDELSSVIGSLQSIDKNLYLHYMEMLRDDSLSVAYIAGQLSDELMSYYTDDVEACDAVRPVSRIFRIGTEPAYTHILKDTVDDEVIDTIRNKGEVTASSGIFYTDKGAGISSRNQVFTEDDLRAAFNSLLAEGDPVATSYDSFESWRDATLDSGLLGVEFLDEDDENPDIDFDETGIEATIKPKYFASMVSASSEDPQSYGYEVRGYYDENRRGLAESEWVEDVSQANEIANDYANKGYYLEIRNNYSGTILEMDPNTWFEDYYPDGTGDF